MAAPPGNPIYDPTVKGYSYDPAKAKQLLNEAGVGAFTMKVLFPNSGAGYIAPVQMHQFIQNNFRDIGVTLELDVREYGAFLETARKGTTDEILAANSNWTSTSGDPYYLEQLGSWKFDVPKGNNRSHYNNPEYDKLLDQARGEIDEQKRNQLYKQAERIIYDDAPWLFVVYDQSPKAYRKDRLVNMKFAAANFISLVNVSLK
jgi:ABC-type transport system substrate-binding protein